mmetsp:Transcript_34871/g.74349  ORF Transcript_34871/g.74349 Transcript_34871/m.74349 type:complete len:291 (-) Transcript_34871:2780-3652(-)
MILNAFNPSTSALCLIKWESNSIPSFCSAAAFSRISIRCRSSCSLSPRATPMAPPSALDDALTALSCIHFERVWACVFTAPTELTAASTRRCIGLLCVGLFGLPFDDSWAGWLGTALDIPFTCANGASKNGNPSAKWALASKLIGLLLRYSAKIPLAMSGRGKMSMMRPSRRISKSLFLRQVKTSSVPRAQQVGSALNSEGATCPQEQLLEFSFDWIFRCIRSSACLSSKLELMMRAFISSVSRDQSASRLFRMASVDSCILILINSVRSKNPPMELSPSSSEGMLIRCS